MFARSLITNASYFSPCYTQYFMLWRHRKSKRGLRWHEAVVYLYGWFWSAPITKAVYKIFTECIKYSQNTIGSKVSWTRQNFLLYLCGRVPKSAIVTRTEWRRKSSIRYLVGIIVYFVKSVRVTNCIFYNRRHEWKHFVEVTERASWVFIVIVCHCVCRRKKRFCAWPTYK